MQRLMQRWELTSKEIRDLWTLRVRAAVNPLKLEGTGHIPTGFQTEKHKLMALITSSRDGVAEFTAWRRDHYSGELTSVGGLEIQHQDVIGRLATVQQSTAREGNNINH